METNQKELEPKTIDREAAIKRMHEQLELFNLQAEVAEARARIKKANLEEILFTLKISELQKPTNESKPKNKAS